MKKNLFNVDELLDSRILINSYITDETGRTIVSFTNQLGFNADFTANDSIKNLLERNKLAMPFKCKIFKIGNRYSFIM